MTEDEQDKVSERGEKQKIDIALPHFSDEPNPLPPATPASLPRAINNEQVEVLPPKTELKTAFVVDRPCQRFLNKEHIQKREDKNDCYSDGMSAFEFDLNSPALGGFDGEASEGDIFSFDPCFVAQHLPTGKVLFLGMFSGCICEFDQCMHRDS